MDAKRDRTREDHLNGKEIIDFFNSSDAPLQIMDLVNVEGPLAVPPGEFPHNLKQVRPAFQTVR